jgi:hypothetical protein
MRIVRWVKYIPCFYKNAGVVLIRAGDPMIIGADMIAGAFGSRLFLLFTRRERSSGREYIYLDLYGLPVHK